MTEYVSLVDDQDNEIGVMEKMQAHQEALLHRAISVFIFNDKKELLLQQRAEEKYHSPLLWTNTCCSHPRPGEVLMDAANRRLMEEMRMACNLTYEFSFTYKAVLTEELTEHEFDHVFFGESNTLPVPDPSEVADWKYMPLEEIENDMEKNPGVYTSWFKLMLDKIKSVRNDHTD